MKRYLFKAKKADKDETVIGCLCYEGYCGKDNYTAMFCKDGFHYRIDESTIEPYEGD